MAAIGEISADGRLGLIKRVSPSRAATLLACRLSEAFRAGSGSVPRLPTHPKAHFGTLAHDFLHKAAQGRFSDFSEASLKAAWRSLVESYEARLTNDPSEANVVPLSRSCDDFEVNAIRLLKGVTASQVKAALSPDRTHEGASLEVEAESKDGLVAGRLDRLSRRGGSWVITDFKTGSIDDGAGSLRADLKIQVMLYGYLAHEKIGQWPESMRVVPMNGSPIEVLATPSEMETLAARTKLVLTETNQSILEVLSGRKTESELATPAPSICKFCRYRPTCVAYWSAREQNSNEKWPRDVCGTVTAIKPLGVQAAVLELSDKGVGTIVARGIPELALRRTTQGSLIKILDLKSERAVGVYSWKPTSFLCRTRDAETAPA